MPEPTTTIEGTITHVFAHRFVVKTAKGSQLADVTPKGLEQTDLAVGDHVMLEGEMKPSELKVSRLVLDGKSFHIEHKKKHDHHTHADPAVVLAAARDAGFEPVGTPRRKPKHFEVLGRRKGALSELHIELDGHIRKTKPIEPDDHKWARLV